MGAAVNREPTEARIMDAATALFSERGYHGASMRELAERAGIRAGSVYNHFASKQELLYRIAHDVMTELHAGALAAIEPHDEPRERLRAWVCWHVAYHARHSARARVADEHLHALDGRARSRVIAVRDRYERLIRQLVEDGRDTHGWIVPDLAIVAFAVSTMCTAVDSWYREGGRLGPETIGDAYADFVLRALEPR
jgi:AcrR family transcriptional regulator